MSDNSPPKSKFQQKLEERRLREEAETQSKTFDADLVPDNPYERTEADLALERAIQLIPFADAYRRYIGKEQMPERQGQVEGIKISCPIPGHRDADPSAWYNSKTKLWDCGGCVKGGDILDIAAIGKGLAWPDIYKRDGSFHKLKVEMAEDFGFIITKLPGGAVDITVPTLEGEDKPGKSDISDSSHNSDNSDNSAHPETADSTDAEIIELYEEEENILVPRLDWKQLIEPGTFLHAYMKAVKVDDVPLEFHLFHALTALGMALGRDVRLFDSVPVYGNLFICTLGRSGSGKSKAKYHLDRLLEMALPYKHDDPNSKGVKKISAPGSAEVLIHNFQKPVTDPANPKLVLYNAPVRGLISYNELSSLLGRSNRMGSVIKPTLMQFYDMENTVSTSSMSTGVKEAAQPFASAITSSQPKALKDLLSNNDDSSGFLNRWAFVLATPKKKFAIGGTTVDMRPAVKPLEEVFAWAGTFKRDEVITWSEDAIETFTEFFYERIEPDKERTQSDMMVRVDLLMKKLILLLTANIRLKQVPVEVVNAVISMYPYLLAGYAVPADEVNKTLSSEIQEAILYIALKQYKLDGKGVTMRHLVKALWRRKYPTKMLLDTADALVKVGFLKLESPQVGQQGRPAVRYRYVD